MTLPTHESCGNVLQEIDKQVRAVKHVDIRIVEESEDDFIIIDWNDEPRYTTDESVTYIHVDCGLPLNTAEIDRLAIKGLA